MPGIRCRVCRQKGEFLADYLSGTHFEGPVVQLSNIIGNRSPSHAEQLCRLEDTLTLCLVVLPLRLLLVLMGAILVVHHCTPLCFTPAHSLL